MPNMREAGTVPGARPDRSWSAGRRVGPGRRALKGLGAAFGFLAHVASLPVGAVEPHASPEAVVPAPGKLRPEALPDLPDWFLKRSLGDRFEFSLDLDLLAPLGNGKGNLADYLSRFTPPGGARFAEWNRALTNDGRVVERKGVKLRVLPGEHPLLVEAEPWVDQATCRFYPDVYKLEGYHSVFPNLRQAVVLAESWRARAAQQANPEEALPDLRRAMRLGRLLFDEDAVLIQNVIALRIVASAAEGLYENARERKDPGAMLVAARVHADAVAMRFGLARYIEIRSFTDPADLKVIFEAVGAPERRLRLEALAQLYCVSRMAPEADRARAAAAIKGNVGATDPLVAAQAAWARDTEWDPELCELTVHEH